jgi:hypothetical protein
MPQPGPGGVQTSLVGRVQGMMASARAAFGRKPGAPVQSPGDKNNPPDLTQFKETFQPEVAPGAEFIISRIERLAASKRVRDSQRSEDEP